MPLRPFIPPPELISAAVARAAVPPSQRRVCAGCHGAPGRLAGIGTHAAKPRPATS